ncbi:hypothetical protein Lal_00023811 [Lupinus albus]|nr:hypothetical protein Lal_00023811 [Lupinus albus]
MQIKRNTAKILIVQSYLQAKPINNKDMEKDEDEDEDDDKKVQEKYEKGKSQWHREGKAFLPDSIHEAAHVLVIIHEENDDNKVQNHSNRCIRRQGAETEVQHPWSLYLCKITYVFM